VDVDRRVKFRRLAAEWAERTAIEQGLPTTIEDEPTLQQIARLLFSPAA
jgi:hypothetical protein